MALKIVNSTAAPGQGFLKLALYGKAGSGKTLTSLLVAERLSALAGKRILYIDTEDGTTFYRLAVVERKVHPDAFDFDLLLTRSITDVIEALESVGRDYGVVVVDSATHLWEAAQAAYAGKRTSRGGIPVQAWGEIKKPWKRMVQLLLDGDYHSIICGREGVVMEESDDGELKVVGSRMKAEGETPFEPHVLGRMLPERLEDGTTKVRVYFEKDRSGVLSGRIFDWPDFSTFEPLVRYLSGTDQPKLGTADDAAERDAAALEVAREREDEERKTLFGQIETAINNARSMPELKSAWDLTKGKKGKLGESFEALEAIKDARKARLMEVA